PPLLEQVQQYYFEISYLKMRKCSPIIIIGMHRSGTSLLSRIFEHFQIYMGRKKDFHNESQYFQQINKWIIKNLDASWDKPVFKLAKRPIYTEIVNLAERNTYSLNTIKYLGIKK